MARIRLARRLAQETGASLRQAVRFIDEVGSRNARRALRSAEDRTTWKLPATVGIGTGGVLAWREQNVREAEALAEESRSATDALEEIIASDMDPDDKRELVELFITQHEEDEDSASRFPWEFFDGDGMGGVEATVVQIIVLLVVLVIVLNFILGQLPQPSVRVGGR